MEYSSHIKIASKACEGVEFTILRMTWRRRAVLREKQAKTRELLSTLQAEMAPLSQAYREAVEVAKAAIPPDSVATPAGGAGKLKHAPPPIEFDAGKLKELMRISAAANRIDAEELTPEAVGFALVGIDGLIIDGAPATLELLLDRGPDELYSEIALAVAKELGLLPDEAENLESPSTSAAAVDGNEAPGSAADAGKLVTISGGDVPSITDPASAIAASMP